MAPQSLVCDGGSEDGESVRLWSGGNGMELVLESMSETALAVVASAERDVDGGAPHASNPALDPFEDGMRALGEKLKKISANTIEQESGIAGSGFCSRDECFLNLVGRDVAAQEVERVRSEGEQRIKRMDATFKLISKARARRVDEVRSRGRVFDAMASGATARCKAKALGFERQLRLQLNTAIKRLQELVFECLGETEKTMARLEDATKHKDEDSIGQRRQTVESLRWKLFLERLREDSLGYITLKNVSPVHDNALFVRLLEQYGRDICNSISSTECAFERFALVGYDPSKALPGQSSVIKSSRGQYSGGNGTFRRAPVLAEFNMETHTVLTTLFGDSGIRNAVATPKRLHDNHGSNSNDTSREQTTVNFHRRMLKGSRRLPLYDGNLLLSTQTASWLLWPQFGRAPVGCHVYFCLEERNRKVPSNGMKSITTVLTDIYVGKESRHAFVGKHLEAVSQRCSDKHWPSGLVVDRSEGRHRAHYSVQQFSDNKLEELVKAFPDIVVTEKIVETDDSFSYDSSHNSSNSSYHFAPATVNHLLETERFMDLNTRAFGALDRASIRDKYGATVTHNALTALYAVFPKEPAAVVALSGVSEVGEAPLWPDPAGEALQMVPLPPEALDELIGCYVLRSVHSENNAKSLLETSRLHAAIFPNNLDHVVNGNKDGDRARDEISRSKMGNVGNSKRLINTGKLDCKTSTPRNKKDANSGGGGGHAREYHALLACFSRNEKQEEPITTDRSQKSNKSVNSGDGALCLWRACNTPHCPGNGVGLCEHHFEFYEKLAEEDPAEIKRHVPRQGLVTLGKHKDVASILKASSLISELLSSKLGSTVNGFCSRAANAARPKQHQDGSLRKDKAHELRDPKKRIRLAQLRRKSLEVEIDLARKVEGAEREVVAELQKYVRLGVFPSDELVRIRQEYKVLNEERVALFALDTTASSSSKKKKSKGNAEQESKRLFRSRAHFLQVEFQTLVENKAISPNQLKADCEEAGSDASEDADNDADKEGIVFLGQTRPSPALKRERHLIEAELELEFCLRKINILRQKRVQLEGSNDTVIFVPPQPQQKVVRSNLNAISRVLGGGSKRKTKY